MILKNEPVDKEVIFDELSNIEFVTKKGKRNKDTCKYANVPCSFDIEVSSFYYAGKKQSLMYVWQFGLNGYVTMGRTWEEFVEFMREIVYRLGLSEDVRLVIYVHNLAYEFQFIKDLFTWDDIFAREKRAPMKATTIDGLEFRCSYMLSGCKLDLTAKNLTNHKINKLVGDLDYELIRTPETPLTEEEIGYCVNDVLIVMALIDEEIAEWGDITKIPMTNTGKVRNYCRERTIYGKHKKEYKKLMDDLIITSSEEYDMLKRAFQGGFTHANYNKVGFVYEDVQSYDFTSSYPTVMVAEKFPMSRGELIKVKDINELIDLSDDYCLIFNIEFTNIVSQIDYEHYLSYSKCYGVEEPCVDNGRLISAAKLQTTITNIDLEIILRAYSWDDCRIGRCYAYKKAYLPTDFVKCVLNFYTDKTTLKDVEGMEKEYTLKKGMLNSTFGMTVTDIVNDEIRYTDEWFEEESDTDECLSDYNNSNSRFLYYPWGVFITAYARFNLWQGIFECGNDYIYSDTDSIKITNPDLHKEFIMNYNYDIEDKLTKACMFHNIDVNQIAPRTKSGKVKPLGVWDDDGRYLRFKTLGAKRYLVDTGEKLKCTIAGVNKSLTSKWLSSFDNGFEVFNDNMSVDKDNSGRMVVTYIDDPMDGIIEDYLGNKYEYHELSGIHMEKGEYHLTMSPLYLKLLRGREVNVL